VRLDRKTVKALAMVVMTEPMHGLPCFQLGVAVPAAYRGKGFAKDVVTAAVAELENGLKRNNIPHFYIEAVVNLDNEPSKRVAEATISPTATAVTDKDSGLPALHYVRKL
jgi:RimJ/RimL family protein N-acetyltransferase